jgi:hypothetical protein
MFKIDYDAINLQPSSSFEDGNTEIKFLEEEEKEKIFKKNEGSIIIQ